MTKTIDLQVNAKNIADIKKGYPLILKEAIINTDVFRKKATSFDWWIRDRRFVAKGYYGNQNKGIGWVLTRKEDEEIDFDFFESKIATALARREALFADPDTTAFRVFNGEGDGIGGLTIDYFDGFYMVSWYSEGIYSLKHHVYSVWTKSLSTKGYMRRNDLMRKASTSSRMILLVVSKVISRSSSRKMA